MPDKRTPPASTLDALQSVPDSALRRLKQYSGRLATEAVHAAILVDDFAPEEIGKGDMGKGVEPSTRQKPAVVLSM